MITKLFVCWLCFNVGVWLGGRMNAYRGHAVGNIYGIMYGFPNLVLLAILVVSVVSSALGGAQLWRW
jgi:hypothetical protein